MELIHRLVNTSREVARLRARVADLSRELAAERRARERERRNARHDPLTGLPNRLALTEHADRFPVTAVAMMDLNRFKPINDEFGHAIGDAVLVEIAVRITVVLGRAWLVARLGGDEFAALREGPVDGPELVAEATALTAAVAEPMRVDQHVLNVFCSVGLVAATGPVSLSLLLGRADAALYRSKANGGLPVVWHPQQDEDSMPRAGVRPALRTRDLRRAQVGGRSVLVVSDTDLPTMSPTVGRVRIAVGVS